MVWPPHPSAQVESLLEYCRIKLRSIPISTTFGRKLQELVCQLQLFRINLLSPKKHPKTPPTMFTLSNLPKSQIFQFLCTHSKLAKYSNFYPPQDSLVLVIGSLLHISEILSFIIDPHILIINHSHGYPDYHPNNHDFHLPDREDEEERTESSLA